MCRTKKKGTTIIMAPPPPPLPIDIMITIFLKLPVVSLLRCECVCNLWRKIIVDCRRSAATKESQLVLFRRFRGESPCFKLYAVNLDISSNTFTVSQNPISTFAFKPMVPIYNLGYGLFLLGVGKFFPDDSPGFLYNPITRETLHLPPPAINMLEFGMHYNAHGLCFDKSTEQYKLVRVWLLTKPSLRTPKQVVEVYTLGSNEWKQITAVPPYCVFEIAAQAYGDLHWALLQPEEACVVSFDIMKEKFKVTPMPRAIDINNSLSCLFTWREELALLTANKDTRMQIWSLRDYDNNNSNWEKVCELTFPPNTPMPHLVKRYCAAWDDGIVFDIGLVENKKTGDSRHTLLHWNTKEGRITSMVNESPLPWPQPRINHGLPRWCINNARRYDELLTNLKFNLVSFSRSPSFA